MQKYKILYLDREVNNLMIFKSIFRQRYEIFTTDSEMEALQILWEHKIAVILADQHNRNTTGFEFIHGRFLIHPVPIKIAVTAHLYTEVLEEALLKNEIFQIISKPFSEMKVAFWIAKGCSRYQEKNRM